MAAYSLPKATLGRIPLYVQYLRELSEEDGSTISATKISRGLSLGEVLVRKDLSLISGCGKPKIGYERTKLIADLERHISCETLTNAVLVGAGKLGKALLDYSGFEEFGIKVIAGFDCNEKELQINKNRSVLPIKDMPAFCAENNVKIGIITVGQGSAQGVSDLLVQCGVRAIWNFAPCSITVPDDILIKQENLALSLAHLSSQLKNKK